MTTYSLAEKTPVLPADGAYWVAPGAHVVGDVRLAEDVGIWFGAVLRGDNEMLTLGAGTNVQEHAIIHADPGFPVTIGNDVTIGHRAIVHGCTIGDNTLVGMGATVLNGACIGRNCLIGAGALVTEGKEIPDGSLVIGSPAKVVRVLSDEAISGLGKSAASYIAKWKCFAKELQPLD